MTTPKRACPFCELEPGHTLVQNRTAFAMPDGFPISRGHTLVIPKRHVASLFDLGATEIAEVWQLVAALRELLVGQHQPNGFNIGLNDGIAAGQTIMHAHVHVVPRYKDDVPDPRGGVRWIIPDKARYW